MPRTSMISGSLRPILVSLLSGRTHRMPALMPNFTKRLAVSVWMLLVLACHPIPGSAQDNPTELTLREADQLLQSRNRDLRLARRALEAARANTLTAGARPNPNLSLGVASINPQVGVGPGGWRDKTVDSSVRL